MGIEGRKKAALSDLPLGPVPLTGQRPNRPNGAGALPPPVRARPCDWVEFVTQETGC